MILVACEASRGFRDSEVTVGVREFGGGEQFLRVERDFLIDEGGRSFLTVGLIQKDKTGQYLLVELPHEADSGTSRLWVSIDDVRFLATHEMFSMRGPQGAVNS